MLLAAPSKVAFPSRRMELPLAGVSVLVPALQAASLRSRTAGAVTSFTAVSPTTVT